jgi:putative addiction module component (TIGR02574 family)
MKASDLTQLPVAERLELIEQLWDSLEGEADEIPMPEWHRQEIDARLDALDSGSSAGSSWKHVRQRLTGKT